MKQVYFFEFWNISPHLETSFELAKRHLEAGDEVYYFFCGHDTPYWECTQGYRRIRFLSPCLPENKGSRLLTYPRFHYHGRVAIPAVSWQPPADVRSLEELAAITYEGCEVGLAALSSLLFRTRASEPDLAQHAGLVRRMLLSGANVYEFARGILAEGRPDLVYVFNGRFCNHRSVMHAARELGIPVLVHERGANRNRFAVRPFMPHDFQRVQQEMLEAWEGAKDDPAARERAQQFFLARREGQEQGWKPFTSGQARGALPALPADKRIITYFSSSDDEFRAVGDIVKWERWPNQASALRDLISLCEALPDVQLVVRIHPHIAEKSPQDQVFWRDLCRSGHVLVVEATSMIDTYALVERSDIVVTGGSTVGIEAVFWGTPSVCLGPSMYSSLDAVCLPNNRDELRHLLAGSAFNGDPARALPYGYYMATFGECFRYYEADALFSGRFMGVDLQADTGPCRVLMPLRWLTRFARSLRQRGSASVTVPRSADRERTQ